jgi:methylenetetrahydrofolate reductase (NADPH)
MKITEHLKNIVNPQFSFEIVPPPRGRSVNDITYIVSEIEKFKPKWIDVTAHASEAYYHERTDGQVDRRIFKKRPGTMGICGIIQNRFKIDTVAHLLCLGFTREETEDALIELNYLGIENVLALRGDAVNYKKPTSSSRTSNPYAADLVEQIKDLSHGKFISEIDNGSNLDFCVGVAGYPEKHFEAPNLKTDIDHLKRKIDKGADYITTQMFFDNSQFYRYVDACRAAGISVPIVPGLKMIKNKNQLVSIPKNFYINLPEELVSPIADGRVSASDAGQNWASQQIADLIKNDFKHIHLYVMNDIQLVVNVLENFKS